MSKPSDSITLTEAELDALLVVRTVTVFIPASHCAPPSVFSAALARAASQAAALRSALSAAGYIVQTIRVAAAGPAAFGSAEAALQAAQQLDSAAVDYASLGTVRPSDGVPFTTTDFMAGVVAQTTRVALSAQLCEPRGVLSRAMAREVAVAVRRVAAVSPDGFENLRFAAAVHIPAGGPFFPTAYAPDTIIPDKSPPPDSSAGSDGGSASPLLPAALGVQGATLLHGVVERALSYSHSPPASTSRADAAFDLLTRAVSIGMQRLATACRTVCNVRVDFSTAPLPEPGHGVAAPLARLANSKLFPGAGGLAAVARTAAAIDAAVFAKTGFCGIMLPVSEDTELAAHPPTLGELLMCSAVCGTGLDTVPVGGDLSERSIEAVFADVAALSCRLGFKPLTIRLMPVPGVKAGERTQFDSPYFSNGPVVAVGDCEGTSREDGALGGIVIAPFSRRE